MKLTIDKESGKTYIPKDIRNAGFVGDDVEAVPNAFTVVLVKPGATSRQIVRSLEILKAHFSLLAEDESTGAVLVKETGKPSLCRE